MEYAHPDKLNFNTSFVGKSTLTYRDEWMNPSAIIESILFYLLLLCIQLTQEGCNFENNTVFLFHIIEFLGLFLFVIGYSLFFLFIYFGRSVMIAPTTTQYLSQVWRGAVVLSFVWFLHRWKTNLFARAMANVSTTGLGLDREKLLALDKFSNLGLLILGLMALAEACGVAVQSILTVGGIGGNALETFMKLHTIKI